KEMDKAERLFQSAFLFVLATAAIAMAATAAILPAIQIESEFKSSILCLTLLVCLNLFNGLNLAIFRSTGNYALGNSLDVTARLFEWIGGIVGLAINDSFISVAIGMLLVRTIALGCNMYIASKQSNHFTWGIKKASKEELLPMIRPSLGFMAFPLGNAVNIQGFTILAGILTGATGAAVFNIYRTISRIAIQFTSTISHSLWPEFSRIYGEGNHDRIKKIFMISNRISIAAA